MPAFSAGITWIFPNIKDTKFLAIYKLNPTPFSKCLEYGILISEDCRQILFGYPCSRIDHRKYDLNVFCNFL